jgi:hypothetical protein
MKSLLLVVKILAQVNLGVAILSGLFFVAIRQQQAQMTVERQQFSYLPLQGNSKFKIQNSKGKSSPKIAQNPQTTDYSERLRHLETQIKIYQTPKVVVERKIIVRQPPVIPKPQPTIPTPPSITPNPSPVTRNPLPPQPPVTSPLKEQKSTSQVTPDSPKGIGKKYTLSIHYANDLAVGLVVAANKRQLNHGTQMYRRVQTAIALLRRGASKAEAVRKAKVPPAVLEQLLKWGSDRPGATRTALTPSEQ